MTYVHVINPCAETLQLVNEIRFGRSKEVGGSVTIIPREQTSDRSRHFRILRTQVSGVNVMFDEVEKGFSFWATGFQGRRNFFATYFSVPFVNKRDQFNIRFVWQLHAV